MAVVIDGTEIVLTGTVGGLFWDDCFDAADVVMALAQVGRDQDITVRINSGGGIATEGSAIYSALSAHKGKVTIVVEGIAASAASIIAMAGDEVVMSLGSLMMVHDPSGVTFGTVAEHELSIKALTALANAMAGIYAEKTGKTIEQARADMQAELWMTPDEAVTAGYANRVGGRAENDNDAPEPTAFDFRLYQHPPERLVALADQHAWTKRTRHLAASSAHSSPRQPEKPMASQKAGSSPATPPADQPATAISRADASEIVTACVAGGVPAMAAALIAEGVAPAEAKTRIAAAGHIKDAVALARRTNPEIPENAADEFVAAGKSLGDVRAELFDKIVAKEAKTETRSHVEVKASDRPAATASMQRELQRAGLTKKGA